MFHRKLSALQYPDAEKFDHTDAGQVRSVALWLEEQKIRHYPAEARAKLRQLDSQQWPEAYQQYIRDLAAPVPADDPDGCLDWLLGRAVRLSYGDNLKKYQSAQSGALSQQSNKTNAPPQNPLDNLDFNSADFVSGVERLAKILDVPCHPDHLITLEAVCILVSERLSSKVLADPSQVVVQGTAFPLDEADLGFDTGDAVLNRAAKVLRLLYIQDMRQLQTAINEILVAVQNLIADPRTDTRLGKVGR